MTLIPYFLVLTFLDTGAVQKYAFASEQECRAIIKPVAQLYEGLRQPIKLECKPRTDIEPKGKQSYTKVKIVYKESYKF
jgi:hypothetical protein